MSLVALYDEGNLQGFITALNFKGVKIKASIVFFNGTPIGRIESWTDFKIDNFVPASLDATITQTWTPGATSADPGTLTNSFSINSISNFQHIPANREIKTATDPPIEFGDYLLLLNGTSTYNTSHLCHDPFLPGNNGPKGTVHIGAQVITYQTLVETGSVFVTQKTWCAEAIYPGPPSSNVVTNTGAAVFFRGDDRQIFTYPPATQSTPALDVFLAGDTVNNIIMVRLPDYEWFP